MNPIQKHKETETITSFAETLISTILEEIICSIPTVTESIVNEKLTEQTKNLSKVIDNSIEMIKHGERVIFSSDLLCISDDELKEFEEKEAIFHSGDVFSEVCNTCLENEDLDDCFSMDSTDKNSCSNGNRKFSEDSEYILEGESDTDLLKGIENDNNVFADFCDFKNDLILLNFCKKAQDEDVASNNEDTLKRGCNKSIHVSLEDSDKSEAAKEPEVTNENATENLTTNQDLGWDKS
jgi:hypothetical protein